MESDTFCMKQVYLVTFHPCSLGIFSSLSVSLWNVEFSGQSTDHQRPSQRNMLNLEQRPSAPENTPMQVAVRHQSLPSPMLCCACGLCIMLAGINITLVGALSFSTFVPARNATIVIGPLLLLIAVAFFTAYCVVSRRPQPHVAHVAKVGESWELMQIGTVAFEMETSENTLQDTTAVLLSPTNSSSSSHKSGSSQESTTPSTRYQDGTGGDNTTLTSSSI